jgi:hypothetical protein
MDTRSLLSGALLVAGLVLAFAGCDGVGTSPEEIESDTTGTSAFRPSPKDSAAISDSLKRVAPDSALTIPIEAVANKPDSTGDCGGGLRFDSVSVSSSLLADASLHDGETEAELEAAPDTTGDVEMAFRPAYGECVSEETGILPVTVARDDEMPQVSNATLTDSTNGDGTVSLGDTVAVSATVTDEGSVSSVAVNGPGFKASAPADGSPVDKGQAASPGDQAGGRAAATGESIEVENVEAEVSAFDAGGGDGTVTLTDEDGDDTYEAAFTVGDGASKGNQSATVMATDGAGNSATAKTDTLEVELEATRPSLDAGASSIDPDTVTTGNTTDFTATVELADLDDVESDGNEVTVALRGYDASDGGDVTETATFAAGEIGEDGTLTVTVEDGAFDGVEAPSAAAYDVEASVDFADEELTDISDQKIDEIMVQQ